MPAITSVAHAELSVRDLDVSSAWYCRLLGAREVFREPTDVRRVGLDHLSITFSDPDGIPLEVFLPARRR